VACLVPNGNVRMEVIGLDTRQPAAAELQQMGRLVRQAMQEGAVGLSSGLDYIPSRHAETEELIALCKEIAPQPMWSSSTPLTSPTNRRTRTADGWL